MRFFQGVWLGVAVCVGGVLLAVLAAVFVFCSVAAGAAFEEEIALGSVLVDWAGGSGIDVTAGVGRT